MKTRSVSNATTTYERNVNEEDELGAWKQNTHPPSFNAHDRLGRRLLVAALFAIITCSMLFMLGLQWQQYQWISHLDLNNLSQSSIDLVRDQTFWMMIFISAQSVGLIVFVGMMLWQYQMLQKKNEEQSQLMAELSRAKSIAEESNLTKSQFLANISHEVRTPFQGLQGVLGVLETMVSDDKQRKYLQTAIQSADHLLGLVNDILDISTIDAGSFKLSTDYINLPQLISDIDQLMCHPAREKGLTLRVHSAPDLPEWVVGDGRRLRQIFFNLINNAIKFTAEGEIVVHWKRLPGMKGYYLVSVRDSGIGMDEKTQSKLFQRFFQADTSIRRRVGGTGLGLEISQNLARRMGGDISVISEVGIGTTFVVMLWLAEPNQEIANQALYDEAPANENQSVSAQKPLQVLVAEDHPVNQQLFTVFIERLGHQVHLAENGRVALDMASHHAFDLLLLDYHMPQLDGLELTRLIREGNYATSRQVPICLITADGLGETRQAAHLAGVNGLLVKPVSEANLANLFNQILKARPTPLVSPVSPTSDSAVTLPEPSPSDNPPDIATIMQLPILSTTQWDEVRKIMSADSFAEVRVSLFSEEKGTAWQCLRMLQEMQHLDDATRHDLKNLAHKLKGACLMLGFERLSAIAGLIEKSAKTETLAFFQTRRSFLQTIIAETQTIIP